MGGSSGGRMCSYICAGIHATDAVSACDVSGTLKHVGVHATAPGTEIQLGCGREVRQLFFGQTHPCAADEAPCHLAISRDGPVFYKAVG